MDLEKLLTPVSQDQPAGGDLRLAAEDETFRQVRDLRKAAVVDPNSQGNWTKILALCETALAKSKDLELAARWTDARVRVDGFAGLRDGLGLVRELVSRFWDTVHPRAQDGNGAVNLEGRRARLEWMAGKDFLMSVERVPLVRTGGGEPRGWIDYRFTTRVDDAKAAADPTAYEELKTGGYISTEEWLQGLGSTPPERLRETLGAVRASLKELQGLSRACDERMGPDAPSLLALGQTLENIETYLAEKTGESSAQGESAGGGSSAVEAGGGNAAAASPGVSGPIRSRAQALQRLQEVADYYRQAEPHSPVSHLVQRAIKWGKLPFEDLVKDFIKDDSTIQRIQETLGIEKKEGT
jgi:type VI secretion system protein ImpA